MASNHEFLNESGEVDTLLVIEEQNRLKQKIKALTGPNAPKIMTREQKQSRVAELESLLNDFKANHNLIVAHGKQDIPYLVNKAGEKTMELIQQTILEINTLIEHPQIPKPRQPVRTATTSLSSDSKDESDPSQLLRIKKLDFKIDNLIYCIKQLENDLSLYTMWTKEYVDIKNRFLCDQWHAISSLEEEIMVDEKDDAKIYDNTKCRDALSQMNDVVKAMISRTCSFSQSTSGSGSKLPDLKVPVFNGDYKRWLNFIDIFESLIDNRPNLSNVQKMEYLKTYLEGEPARLISAYTLSAENYTSALEVLKKRYHNKRKLLTIHLENMFHQVNDNPSAESIKNLYDGITEGKTAIQTMGIDCDTWGPMIVHFAISCLDIESRSLFEQKYNDNNEDIPQLEDLMKFLEGRYKTLEIMDPLRSSSVVQPKTKVHHSNERKAPRERETKKCVKCDGDHKLFMCPRFLSLSTKSRFRFVKGINHCINCLQKHVNKPCECKTLCKQCQKPHNTLLHFNKERSAPEQKTANIGKQFDVHNKSLAAIGFNTEEVLGTACLLVRDVFGNPYTIRALIDTGAQRNFITESLVQKLRLPRLPYRTDITGIGKVNAHQVKHAVELNIEPTFPSNFSIECKALVMGKVLTSNTPETTITESFPEEWPKLQLADFKFRVPGHIDMILGIGLFTKILIPEIKRSDSTGLIAINTRIGWLILGKVQQTASNNCTSVKSIVAISEVREQMSSFWELEEIPGTPVLSTQDKICEDIFHSTHKRLSDGRYVVHLPFKEDFLSADLETSRKRALSRFLSQESKFKRDPEYASNYRKFISEYLALGHMKKVDDNSDGYFMPHHAILKPSSTSTKFRVVFDASARTDMNFSLNSLCHSGPRLQDDLAAIMLRWRIHQYVIAADVEKMFRQIKITPDHQKYQKIFWRNSPDEPLGVYQLTTVTYGTTPASYLAIKSLQQLAKDDGEKFPLAAQVVLKDFYVDDVLTGTDSIETCLDLQKQLHCLLQGGGFTLKKWMSNCQDIVNQVDEESREFMNIKDENGNFLKTLGLAWQPFDDCFVFQPSSINFENIKTTKRSLSSDVSKIFDPLGWLSPIIIVAKVLFQQTWSLNLDWNDTLPSEITEQWKLFRHNLLHIKQIKVPRWVSTSKSSKIELFGFSDASTSAYSAAIYIKSISLQGIVSINLLLAKTKVAPIKQKLSVAKLELCGAHLLAKLFDYVKTSLGWKSISFTPFCDSTITLAWIEGDISRWNIFVANRVSDIRRLTENCMWRYVPTKDNPADCATRGLTPMQLLSKTIWWYGPSWLQWSSELWPIVERPLVNNIPERKRLTLKAAIVNQESTIEDFFSRFSSMEKLKTTVSHCRRFLQNCRSNKKIVGPLTTSEVRTAETIIFRQIQHVYYGKEILNCQQGKPIGNQNGILALAPMMDETGLLRISGRLENTMLSYNEKHPIILPRQCLISKLLVREAHLNCDHGSSSLTEYVVRRKYWIIRCKDLVKNVIFHCVICRKRHAKLLQQRMGQLPVERVTFTNAFYNSGVDFAGPFSLKAWKGRCKKTYKAYVCVFVCMAVKAIHLELVTELSSEAFLAAYRRFSSRRGPCLHLFSDCGTNFVGANNILKNDLRQFHEEWSTHAKTLTIKGVQWHFNPPSMPHAGGLWEAAVKSMKGLLFKHLGPTLLTYEEFLTVLVQIEGSLNSRPLGRLTDSPEDQMILTPNHFLNGTSIFTHPEPDASNLSLSSRWKYLQVLKQHVAQEFKIQMLQSFQVMKKWRQEYPNVKVGDVVMVEDHSLPSHLWPIGLIVEVHPGNDDLVRLVSVKMESGRILKRPIYKISMLPVLENTDLPRPSDPTKLPHSTSTQKHRYNLRHKVRTSKTCLWLGLMLLFTLLLSTFTPTKIDNIDNNSGLFFAKMGTMNSFTI